MDGNSKRENGEGEERLKQKEADSKTMSVRFRSKMEKRPNEQGTKRAAECQSLLAYI